ncbi:hypothetical protein RHMOL_Rhmol03G0091400 [Rhododendron molle]|uniref:Uncharacterized protein n=1 Tax=Rhododendron molle TaxID=49168 RepID=A0ACC0PBV9_RHOML|nr:hypothetical protein RHMOL_Rhmol03G0091400 [Rhododendron molle]
MRILYEGWSPHIENLRKNEMVYKDLRAATVQSEVDLLHHVVRLRVHKSIGACRSGGIRAYTNRKCEAGSDRRRAWVGPTRKELEVLGRVPHETSLRCLSCLRGAIRAYTNRKYETSLTGRRTWVGPTRKKLEVLVMLGRVPNETSLRYLSCLSRYLSHIAWWVVVVGPLSATRTLRF